jgi:hypothetical protein
VNQKARDSQDQIIRLTITTQPNQLLQLPQPLFQKPSPSRSYPIDPLGGPHQIPLTAPMATAFCQTTPNPLGEPVDRPSSLKLGDCILAPSAHSQEFLIPTNRASIRSYPSRNPHPGCSFSRTNQISLLAQPQILKIPRCGIFRPATCKLTPCGISADRQTNGQVSTQPKWGMQYTTREIGCANQATCPFHLTIACLHLTRIPS